MYEQVTLIPRRDIDTYKRMVSLAIEIRELDATIDKGFRLCMPVHYVNMVATHFASRYGYHVLGGCFFDRNSCVVRWYPTS